MKRDAMEMLMNARPDDLDPNALVDAGTRERELARARHGAHGTTTVTAPARRRVRPVWGLGLAGVAAAAVAAAVLVPIGGDGGTPAAKNRDGSRTLDGRTVLLTAAESADRQTDAASSGAYWHVTEVFRQYTRAGAGASAYSVVDEERTENWTPTSPTGLVASRTQKLGAHPATDADKALWRKAGSPTNWTIKYYFPNGKFKAAKLSPKPGKATATRGPMKTHGEWLGRVITVKQIRALPADPKALKAELLRWYAGPGKKAEAEAVRGGEAAKPDLDAWLFDIGLRLVADQPVGPKVRAAAFRMLAGIPGVASLGKVTADGGQRGVAVGLVRPGGNASVDMQTRLIVDPSMGRALATQTVLVKPSRFYPGFPAGSVLNSTVHVGAGWTASVPRLPFVSGQLPDSRHE
ncbi:CU044_5270 family protein [Spirillospora sp. NPDC049652]